jgi:hypothetical protein
MNVLAQQLPRSCDKSQEKTSESTLEPETSKIRRPQSDVKHTKWASRRHTSVRYQISYLTKNNRVYLLLLSKSVLIEWITEKCCYMPLWQFDIQNRITLRADLCRKCSLLPDTHPSHLDACLCLALCVGGVKITSVSEVFKSGCNVSPTVTWRRLVSLPRLLIHTFLICVTKFDEVQM